MDDLAWLGVLWAVAAGMYLSLPEEIGDGEDVVSSDRR